jgi:hypothetical protein
MNCSYNFRWFHFTLVGPSSSVPLLLLFTFLLGIARYTMAQTPKQSNNSNDRMNAIDVSPPLSSNFAGDFRADAIPQGANVTDQHCLDAAIEVARRSILREIDPDAVTNAELASSKRRKVMVDNVAAGQAYPDAHPNQNQLLQAIQGLGTRIDNLGTRMDNLETRLGTRMDNLGARMDNLGVDLRAELQVEIRYLGDRIDTRLDDLGAELRTRSSNNEKV